jgi:ADP-ribose pyrophosphatase YjhB (NUDIX family)
VEIVGVFAKMTHEEAVSVYLLKAHRGEGLGEELIEMLTGRDLSVATHAKCNVVRYYEGYGWKVSRQIQNGEIVILEPPTHYSTQKASTACIYDPVTRAVLLGKRLSDPWKDHWAFPGGRVEDGESAHQAMVRELREELHVTLPMNAPIVDVRVLFVGNGKQIYEVTCHVIEVATNQIDPKPSEEMEPAWIPINSAPHMRPMGSGTKRILRSLSRQYATTHDR